MTLGRARGALLRLVRHRTLAIVVGAALTVPAAWFELGGRSGAWWIDGVSLVLGATGLALLWSGISGVKPDWIDGSKK